MTLKIKTDKPVSLPNFDHGEPQVDHAPPHNDGEPYHRWYGFVLGFDPEFARQSLSKFDLLTGANVLDPFAGMGTTLVECQKTGRLQGIGIEVNPWAQFVSAIKCDWGIEPDDLISLFNLVSGEAQRIWAAQGIDDDRMTAAPSLPLLSLPEAAAQAMINNSISPLPLHKVLTIYELLQTYSEHPAYHHATLALGKAIEWVSNLKYAPEISVKNIRNDAQLISAWRQAIYRMVNDLTQAPAQYLQSVIHLSDARQSSRVIPPASIDAVITSPPYPNEKDYTRATRLPTVALGFAHGRADLATHRKGMIRSNSKGIYKGDQDHLWVTHNGMVQELAEHIEATRVAMGKTSGFERQYANVVRQYFGGMARHLADLRRCLKPGARLVYLVGDQASYFRVKIPVAAMLGSIAVELGYKHTGTVTYRRRFATVTGDWLDENELQLTWP